MNAMKKMTVIAMAAMLSVVLFAGMASAHVTVWPKAATQGSYEVFTVRVPSESENVTTKSVRLTVPDAVKVSRVEPKAGWTYAIEQNAEGGITKVTWTSEGEGLKQTEFAEFRVSGKVAEDATELIWKAYQTYSDNSVVEWIGAADADYPASVTTVAPGAAEGDGHHGAAASADAAAEEATNGESKLPLILSIVAVVLAAIAAVRSFAGKK
ncbi:YcnI family copper-binding membrane protein [Paenibacillus xanthanilyticus]|uniref:YcnI family protein n=2 Tax=Paenibacillus xanthanilyticus TaxID=1783531 RepID=A0ABV8K2L8_9BACL